MNCTFCNKHFNPNKEGSGGMNRKFCFSCMPEGLSKEERKEVRRKLLTLKSREHKVRLGCSNCGYNKNPSALEWHHPDEDKYKNPACTIQRSWETYLKEVSKCTLLCSNCHREKHFPWS